MDEDLHNDFKMVARVTGDTMTDVVTHAVQEYVKTMRMLINGMSPTELLDYCNYKLHRAERVAKELEDQIENK